MKNYLKNMQLYERVMETRDHFKNGANPKSLMSKVNNTFVSFQCTMLLIALLCTTPAVFAQPPSSEVQKLFLNAVNSNDLEKVKMFLKNGASATFHEPRTVYWEVMGEKDGEDPLIRAIRHKSNDVATFLIQYDRNVLMPRKIVDAYGKFEYFATPLEYAIRDNKEMVDVLLQETFHPTAGDSKLNETIKKSVLLTNPVRAALNKEDYDLMAKLQEYGFKINQNDLDNCLYKVASDCSKYDICKTLLGLGANPSAIIKIRRSSAVGDNDDVTALIKSIAGDGCQENAKLFIEHGASVNKVVNSRTPIFYAVQKANNLEFIQYLINKGANINVTGYTDGGPKSILAIARAEYKEFLILNGAR